MNMSLDDFIAANEELSYQLLEEYYPQCIHKVMDGWYEPTEYPDVFKVMKDLYDAELAKYISARSYDIDYLYDKMCEYA